MKFLISLFVLVFCYQITHANKFDTRVTQDFKNTSLKEVFVVLQDRYDFKIAYGDRLIQDLIINVSIKNKTISETLELILEGTSLTYELIPPDAIIIKKGNENDQLFDLIGEVIDYESGERLPYAYLYCPTLDRGLMSNKEGYFTLGDVPAQIEIQCKYLGYKDTTYLVNKSGYNERLIVGLSPVNSMLDELLVSDDIISDFSILDQPAVINIDPKLGVKAPRLAEPDAIRAIHLLPGVNATNELSSRLFVNGGTANQNMVTFDGFTIYHMDHFFGYYSAVNPYAAKSMRLFKGGFESKYGGRASSILEVTGKDGNNTKISGNASVNLLSINSSLEIPINKKTTLFLSGRRSYTDIFMTSLFDEIISIYGEEVINKEAAFRVDNQEFVPEFYYSDLNVKVSTRIGAKNRASFSFYNSNDLLNYDESYDVLYEEGNSVFIDNVGLVNWGSVGTSAKWSTLWNANHFTSAMVSYSYYASKYRELSLQSYKDEGVLETINVTVNENNRIQDFSAKLDHEWTLDNNLVETGVSMSLYGTAIKGTLNDNLTLDDSTIVSKEQSNEVLATHYLQNKFRGNSDFQFTLGMRSNYLTTTERFYFEPRASFTYDVNSNLVLNGATGVYRQFVNQINTENALEGSRDLWILSDNDIPDQRAIHAMVGFTKKLNNSLISVNFYYKDFEGVMDYAFADGQFITEYVNYEDLFFEGSGYAQGLEFLFKKNIGNLNAWAGYTLGEIVYSFAEINEGRPYFADHDQTHEINLYASYTLGKLELYSTWYYGSGKPYTEPSLSNDIVPQSRRVTLISTDGKNEHRLPIYHRLDIGANYKINLGKSLLTLSANMFNLYDRENVYDRDIQVLLPRDVIGTVLGIPIINEYDINLMGITPSLSLEISF